MKVSLLAQLPMANREELVTFFLCLCGVALFFSWVVNIINGVRKMTEKKKPEEQFVTKQELSCVESGFTQKLSAIELSLASCALKDDLTRFQEYTRQNFHDMRNAMGLLSMGVKVIETLMVGQKEQIGQLLADEKRNHEQDIELRAILREVVVGNRRILEDKGDHHVG